jgi:glutathione S-transferase
MYPYATLGTVGALFVYIGVTMLVGVARGKYKIAAPAMTGDIKFEKRARVQANTLEQLATFLPALWLCAVWVGDDWAGLGAAVWIVGRVLYARSYYANPAKRGPGFLIAYLASFAMLVGVVVQTLLDIS